MAAKPIVDGIEREHEQQLIVIRLNVQDPVGEALLERYGFRFTPTFIFFDGAGDEIQRWVGAIDSVEVRQLLQDLPS
jgi:thioredoxin-related protein